MADLERYQHPEATNDFPDMETITPHTAGRNKKMSASRKEEAEAYAKDLADRIAQGVEACLGRGMTREGISSAMNYPSISSLSKWCSGSVSPGPANLAKLAKATGLSLDWLIMERGPMFAPTKGDSRRLEVIEAIASRRVPDEVVKELVDPTPGL